MNIETLALYEAYFQNQDNHKINICEIACHHCRFCSTEEIIIKVYYCKEDMCKVILEYLNHLKLMSCSWEKVKYVFRSMKICGFLAEGFVAKWSMLKWKEKDVFIVCSFK